MNGFVQALAPSRDGRAPVTARQSAPASLKPLDNGTIIVNGGTVVPGAPPVNIATIDFLARGGDGYPFAGAPFTTMGVSYQQALFNLIVDDEAGLGGLISAAQYPEGGEGRITVVP